MGEMNNRLTETLWKVALGALEELPEYMQTPAAMKEFFEAPFVPYPVLALVFDRMIERNGCEFLMSQEYAEVLHELVDCAEDTFHVLQGKLSTTIERREKLASASKTALRNILHFVTDGFQMKLDYGIREDIYDILCTDKTWEEINWLINGKLIASNRIDAALILLYCSPWLPRNCKKYLKIMSVGTGLPDSFFANIVFCPKKLSFFLSTHNFYDIESIQHHTVLQALNFYMHVLITKDRIRPDTFRVDVVPAIWRLIHYEGQRSVEFYEALFVICRDVPSVRELCKKQFRFSSYGECKDYAINHGEEVKKAYSDACLKMLVDTDCTEEELQKDMETFISTVNMQVPIFVSDEDRAHFSHELFRAKIFADMVKDHSTPPTVRYPSLIFDILIGVDDQIPRRTWINAGKAITESEIRRIPTMDLSDDAKQLIYGRLAAFLLNNIDDDRDLLQVVMSMKTYDELQPKDKEED